MAMPSVPLTDQLRTRFTVTEEGCHEYSGHIDSLGYGRLWFKGQMFLAHRAAWEEFRGPIPDGLFVCHRCDNPKCINIGHLFVGTPDDNMQDKVIKGRQKNPLHEEHGMSKLNWDQVKEIRGSDQSANLLASKLGIHPQHVRLIRRRKRVWNDARS